MSARGKFIALEGIDGSGKRTQMDLLDRALSERGIVHMRVSFPQYESFFGRMVAQFLNGDFGPLDAVDAHFSALLYAGDRLEARPALESALASGTWVLADRYIGSNLAHQTARLPPEKRGEFLDWLRQLEYKVYALPQEDLVVYLRLPADEAGRLIERKGARAYTPLKRDLQESSAAHLEQAAAVYDLLAQSPPWVTVECFDPASRAIRSPEAIHADVLSAVEGRLFGSPAAS